MVYVSIIFDPACRVDDLRAFFDSGWMMRVEIAGVLRCAGSVMYYINSDRGCGEWPADSNCVIELNIEIERIPFVPQSSFTFLVAVRDASGDWYHWPGGWIWTHKVRLEAGETIKLEQCIFTINKPADAP